MIKVNTLSVPKRVAVYIAMIFVRLWNRTLKIELSDHAEAVFKRSDDGPKIYVFWHNRLFVAAEVYHLTFHQGANSTTRPSI
jgi:lysophospholipid acyltransferase (LPLAT)-like uncharacterized protein